MATKKKETKTTTAAKTKNTAEKNNKTITTTDKIVAIFDLQQIDSRIDQINHVKGSLPLEVEDMENAVMGAEKLIEKHETEMNEALQAVKIKKEEIEQAKSLIAKYEEQQQNVKNNREFESLGKEIEYQNLEIELCEKRIKEFNAEAKNRKVMVEDAKDILSDRKTELEQKQSELQNIESESAEEMTKLSTEAKKLKTNIDERLFTAYNRIRSNSRNGLAVVTVERDACGGCFNRIPPQRRIDIEATKKVIVCEYCGRILVSSKIKENEQ